MPDAAINDDPLALQPTMRRERWLLLSHCFNMDGRAASQTITDKLPHLRAAGIELVVLSGVSGRLDSHCEHYQLWPAGPAGIRFELRHVLRQRLPSAWAYRTVMTAASLLLLPGMVLEKLLRPLESSWSWCFSATRKGLRLHRQKPFDRIYSTGGAFAAHLAGAALQRATGLPWLAEVHDPLVMPGSTLQRGRPNAQQRMQAQVERSICSHASAAVWFTEQALASARQRNPQLGARGHMLLPGIDAPFQTLPPHATGAYFTVGHFGSLSPTRNLGPFIAALESLRERRPDLVTATQLHVTGGPLDAVSAALLERSPVRDCVRHFGRIEADPASGLSGRAQILQRMRAADVLLLLHGEEAVCAEYIPSKLYEYLWMQRPILATAYRNPQMAGLLREQGHAVIETGNEERDGATPATAALAAALEQLYDRWRSDGLPDSGRLSPYTTAAAVARLLSFVHVKNS